MDRGTDEALEVLRVTSRLRTAMRELLLMESICLRGVIQGGPGLRRRLLLEHSIEALPPLKCRTVTIRTATLEATELAITGPPLEETRDVNSTLALASTP